MEQEQILKFSKLVNEDINRLEERKRKIEKKIDKATSNYSSSNIEKLTRLSNKVNEIDFAICMMYALIDSLDGRLSKE